MKHGFWRPRTFVFFLFLFGFFLSAPLIVLYTAGYRYNFAAGTVLRTGIISITTQPKGTDVYIDDQLVGTTPLILKTIAPGAHTVRLMAKDYTTWQKPVRVESRQTTFVTATLLKNSPRETLYTTPDQHILSFSTHGHTLTYLPQQHDISLLNLYTQKTLPLLTFKEDSAPSVSRVDWSSDGAYVLLTLLGVDKDLPSWRLFATETGEEVSFPPSLLRETEHITSVWFSTYEEHSLNLVTEESLFTYHPETGATERIGNTPIKQYMQLGNDTLVLQDAGAFTSIGFLQGETTRILTYIPGTSAEYRLSKAPEGRVLIEDIDHAHLYLLHPNNSTSPIELDVAGTLPTFSEDGTRLLYTDGFEIFLYQLPTSEKSTITRLSQHITSLAWHPSQEWIMFGTDTDISALETTPIQGSRSRVLLAQGTHLRSLLSADKKTLLLSDAEGDTETIEHIEL